MKFWIMAAMILFSGMSGALAFGFGGGDFGAGCCGTDGGDIPDEMLPHAVELERQIEFADPETVRKLIFLDALCSPEGFRCGILTEDQARKIANHQFQSDQAFWDFWIKVGLGVVAVYGAGLATMTYFRKSH